MTVQSYDLPELKDCPFCGARPVFYDYYTQLWVECGCGLQTSKEWAQRDGKRLVIEEWNGLEPGEYLQKLIRRDTAAQVVWNKDNTFTLCPECGKYPGRENFCANCGQRLDWNKL